MRELSVVILSADQEQRTVLQMQVDGSAVARTAQTFASFPLGTTDVFLKRIQELRPDVILLDLPQREHGQALRAIELLHASVSSAALFAIGEMSQPQVIVDAMRSGAREFLARPVSTNHLLEAFVRLTSQQRKTSTNGKRGKIISVINAKGGNGATTVAVNTALSLLSQGSVALVDLAQLGHVALHLNLQPSFTVRNVFSNLHRLDASLLDSYMTRHASGVHVLAGTSEAGGEPVSTSELSQLFDLLVTTYNNTVVDLSTRLDSGARVICDLSDRVLLVANADVPSLWSAAKVQDFLTGGATSAKVGLVLNRYRKIAGFSDSDVQSATRASVLWKLPNHYPLVSAAIDRGIPVAQQNHSEIARSFTGLADSLTGKAQNNSKAWSIFRAS